MLKDADHPNWPSETPADPLPNPVDFDDIPFAPPEEVV